MAGKSRLVPPFATHLRHHTNAAVVQKISKVCNCCESQWEPMGQIWFNLLQWMCECVVRPTLS